MNDKEVKTARKLAPKYLDEYYGCAQATFKTVLDAMERDYSEEIFSSLVGLSGGVGNHGVGTCGAVTGAVAAIGYSFGITPKNIHNEELREELYSSIDEFISRFREKYDDIPCREVQMSLYGMSFDFKNENGLEKFREISNCEEVVRDCSEIAVGVLLKKEKK